MSIFNDKYWYTADNNDKHEAVFKALENIINSPSGNARTSDFSKYARLYGNADIPISLGLQYSTRDGSTRLTYNVVKSCCDTLTSKITQQIPSVMFLTDGENFFSQEKAKKANKYIESCFYVSNFKSEAKRSFLDSSLFGLGALKVVADKILNTISVERTLPLELFLDEFDALYGKPRNLFQRKLVGKDSLKILWPKHADEVDKAKNPDSSTYQKLYEQAEVVEGWHLPTTKDSHDGRHVICINNCTLLDEEWDKPYFPFIFLQFTDPLLGFWPAGLGEMLVGLQLEINKTLKVIRQIMEYSVPKLIIPAGSSIATQKLTNYVMDVIKVMGGGAPQVMQLASANPQLFTYLAQLFQKAYEIAGISQLSAQAVKPTGLNSGRALRNFYQIESERYAVTEQKWEQFFVEGARMVLNESRELPKFKVTSVSKDGTEVISWKDIDFEDDEYRIQAFPISSLPKTPAGRLETVTDLIQGQFISREQGLELLNYPDVNRVTDLDLSGRRFVRKIVDRILVKDEYTSPEMFDDLAYCIEYAQKAYMLGKLNNVPEPRLNKMVQFMQESKAMMDGLNAQQAPPPAPLQAGGEPAPSRPEIVPQTDLLPMKGGVAPEEGAAPMSVPPIPANIPNE